MLAKGAAVNARMMKNGMKDGQRNRLNRLGATAFFLAAKNTDVEVMKVLAEAGADATIRSADGTTPLMVAAGLMIWDPGEDGGSLAGQEDEVLEAVRMCVRLGNDVNATNQYGETALQGVAYRGVPAVAEYLAGQGAKLDAKDSRGWTPLAMANGLSYSDFYKEQLTTAATVKKLMQAKGLSTDGHAVDGSVCLDCLQTRSDQARGVVERDARMEAEFKQQLASGSRSARPGSWADTLAAAGVCRCLGRGVGAAGGNHSRCGPGLDGSSPAGRHGRGVQPRAHREGAVGRDRWQRAVPDCRAATGHLLGDVPAAGLLHRQA
jgi:hypothetical protein